MRLLECLNLAVPGGSHTHPSQGLRSFTCPLGLSERHVGFSRSLRWAWGLCVHPSTQYMSFSSGPSDMVSSPPDPSGGIGD